MSNQILTWSDYDNLVTTLVNTIQASEKKFDTLLGVSRGGLFLTGSLAYKLGIKKVYVTSLQSYKHSRLGVPLLHYFPQNQVFGSVLVVDDILDTGTTYRTVSELLSGKANIVRWAFLLDKKKTDIKPDYVGMICDAESWIDFPWG